MIAVDSSVLGAIIFKEPERPALYRALLNQDNLLISSATVIEIRMVAYGRGGSDLVLELDDLIDSLGLKIIPLGIKEIEIAHAAFVTYGKGNGHPAQLNFGDLFSYALAKSRGVPLLFKGDDFALTDVEVAG